MTAAPSKHYASPPWPLGKHSGSFWNGLTLQEGISLQGAGSCADVDSGSLQQSLSWEEHGSFGKQSFSVEINSLDIQNEKSL